MNNSNVFQVVAVCFVMWIVGLSFTYAVAGDDTPDDVPSFLSDCALDKWLGEFHCPDGTVWTVENGQAFLEEVE